MVSVTDGRDSKNTAVKIRAALLQGRIDYLSKLRVLLNSIEFRSHRDISVDLNSKFSKKMDALGSMMILRTTQHTG